MHTILDLQNCVHYDVISLINSYSYRLRLRTERPPP